MLTDAQKANVRRHLGYGPVGEPTSPFMEGGSFIGYRFFQKQGLLEFRLNNLSAAEEDILLGTSGTVAPRYDDPDTETTVYGFAPICDMLEGKIPTATDNLDTEKAGEWTARKDEVPARVALYQYWVAKMAQYLYLPLGPSMVAAPGALVN